MCHPAAARNRHFYIRDLQTKISMDECSVIFTVMHGTKMEGPCTFAISHQSIMSANYACKKTKAQYPLTVIVY